MADKQHMITREGKPPLRFNGSLLAEAGAETGTGYHTTVRIYATKSGKFIAEIERCTQWQGQTDTTTAEAFDGFDKLIDWLIEDSGGGTLGRLSQEAVEDAIKERPELREHFVEEV